MYHSHHHPSSPLVTRSDSCVPSSASSWIIHRSPFIRSSIRPSIHPSWHLLINPSLHPSAMSSTASPSSSSASLQFLVRLLDGRTACFSLPSPPSLSAVQLRVERVSGVPSALQRLHCDGRPLRTSTLSALPSFSPFICLSLSLSLLGGKGGFGSLLRATTSAVGAKRTTDFSAMRDLHGRRLRHVEQERAMEEWTATQQSKTEEERRRDRLQLQQRLSNLKRGRRPDRSRCRWAEQCKYRDTCNKLHPDQMEVKEGERGDGVRKRRRKGEMALALVDDSWQAQVVDEEEMQGDIEQGLHTATRRHHREGREGDGHSSDEQSGEEEEEKRKEAPQRQLTRQAAADRGKEAGEEEKEEDEEKAQLREEKEEAEPASAAAPSWRSSRPPQSTVSRSMVCSVEGRRTSTAERTAAAAAVVTTATKTAAAGDVNSAADLSAPSSSSSPSSQPSSKSVCAAPPSSATSCSSSAPSVDLSLYSSAYSLHALGLDGLKAELARRGLKCGGSLSERADRLWLCKAARSLDQLPRKMWATKRS